MIDDNVK